MPLFEIAIVQKPKTKKGAEKLLVAPIPILAEDAKAAGTQVILDRADELKKGKVDLARLDVLVRPFA